METIYDWYTGYFHKWEFLYRVDEDTGRYDYQVPKQFEYYFGSRMPTVYEPRRSPSISPRSVIQDSFEFVS